MTATGAAVIEVADDATETFKRCVGLVKLNGNVASDELLDGMLATFVAQNELLKSLAEAI